MELIKPYLIEFSRIGDPGLGYISVAEKPILPFQIKRVYWTYFTPEDVQRGGHAHFDLEQILVAVAGKIIVKTELIDCTTEEFSLDKPNMGLFVPKLCWREMLYTHNAVQMCLANNEYTKEDYIRDYAEFKKRQSEFINEK